jgi:hypothetical protein
MEGFLVIVLVVVVASVLLVSRPDVWTDFVAWAKARLY